MPLLATPPFPRILRSTIIRLLPLRAAATLDKSTHFFIVQFGPGCTIGVSVGVWRLHRLDSFWTA